MEFTETTITDFFRTVGQPSAGARLNDYLREKNLMLVETIKADEAFNPDAFVELNDKITGD